MATDILDKMAAEAKARIAEIDVAAKYVAHLMEGLHGGDWRVKIDHRLGFVLMVGK
ncbi:hypothetical protein RFM99_28925 [Mesorhizobium sp. VK4C]|uniref:hypothetical protein n=1 Tax=Mesorhizobium captivum TaxID=3072319 RepID=UPI002A23DB69|nr:hypothetical protein [Mesorhizobium sp. VK4C]MDX8502414.1 hypothetical protein [Mesorhizobium sp. VK4C]